MIVALAASSGEGSAAFPTPADQELRFTIIQIPPRQMNTELASLHEVVMWWVRHCLRLLAMPMALSLAACSTLPTRSPVAETRAIDSATPSSLREVALASLDPAFDSAFALLPVASADYESRLALIAIAEHSIDIQAFYWAADDTGTFLLSRLRAAAARGVRVRLLVDDLSSAGTDDLLAAFAREPNVEVRLFNPFPLGRSSTSARLIANIGDLRRINHRMHNKLFVADNAIAIFGGRNTGDEYFMRARMSNFVDFDSIGVGAVVPELSATFDEYWNSSLSYPVADIATSNTLRTQAELRAKLSTAMPPDVDEMVPPFFERFTRIPSELSSGRLTLVGARSQVKADPIDKAERKRRVDYSETLRAFIATQARLAKEELFIVSPYFVPGDRGMETMRMLRAKGIRIRILTNSLAATDEPSVYAGYRRYRRELLELGVEIYELSPGLTQKAKHLGRFGQTLGMLHMKIGVIDRRRLFVGSMNLDGRSERFNTELGVLIDSAPLANSFIELVRYENSAYRLRIEPDSRELQWVEGEGDGERVFTTEPETTWWLRAKSTLVGNLVPEDWL